MRRNLGKIVVAVVIACMMLTGCSNQYARSQYDSDFKIAQSSDQYTKSNSVLNNIGDSITLTVGKFDGRETIWSGEYSGEQEVPVKVTFTLAAGKAKLVHIDENSNVETIVECTADTVINDAVCYTVAMKKGINKLKVVGYDCEDMNLSIDEK